MRINIKILGIDMYKLIRYTLIPLLFISYIALERLGIVDELIDKFSSSTNTQQNNTITANDRPVHTENNNTNSENIINALPKLDYEYIGRIFPVDGDSFKTETRMEIRLWGIDAPEYKQNCRYQAKQVKCGVESKNFLSNMVDNQTIYCKAIDKDRYGRHISRCFLSNGVELNNTVVEEGWAVDYTHYSEGFYKYSEEIAKANKKGIWRYEFENPRSWRQNNN